MISDPQLINVIASWQTSDPLPTLTTKRVPPPLPNNPPFRGVNPAALSQWAAWVPPDPVPTLTGHMRPAPRSWLSTVFSPWRLTTSSPPLSAQFQPPGTTAHLPVYNWVSSVLATWWIPPDPLPTLTAKRTPPSVDNPPRPGSLGAFAKQPSTVWQAPDPLPNLGTKKLTPPQSVDRPPIGGQHPQHLWGAPWAAPDPLPTLTVKLKPPSVDNPPRRVVDTRLWSVLAAWLLPPDPLPTLSVKSTPRSVDNPPFSSSHFQPWNLPPDPLPNLGNEKVVQPYIPSATYAYSTPWQSIVLSAWVPPDPQPTLAGKVNPSIISIRTDNPPRISHWLSGVLDTWTRPTDPIQTWHPLIPQGGPNHPTVVWPWLSSVLSAWVPPDPLPTLTAKRTPPSVDRPPVTDTAWQQFWPAWQPPDPVPTLGHKLPPAVASIPTNNPPWIGGSRAMSTILASWVPPDPPPTRPKVLPIRVITVYNPPFTQNFWLPTVLTAWVPPFLMPVLHPTPYTPEKFILPDHRTTRGPNVPRKIPPPTIILPRYSAFGLTFNQRINSAYLAALFGV